MNCKVPHVSYSMLHPAYNREKKAMKNEPVQNRYAPVKVTSDWRAKGKYVDHSKSTAQAVAAFNLRTREGLKR